jgi:hypothetical protein
MLQVAAKRAGITVAEMDERLAQIPGGEELLIKTIRAAMEASAENKLLALSESLSQAATAGDELSTTFESQFVSAVADLDTAHFRVLERFEWSANELGLGDGHSSDFDRPLMKLNQIQLAMVLPDLADLLIALVTGLERHGLLGTVVAYQAPLGGGVQGPLVWEITPFGRATVARPRSIGAMLQGETSL